MNIKAKLLSRITVIYVTFILTWSGLWWLIGNSRHWWMVTLTYFQVELLAPAFFIFIVVVITQKRTLIPLSFVPLILFVGIFWPYFIPRPAIEREANLRVMTYNVLFSNTNYPAVANVIKTHQPDLVALQEVQPEMMSALKKALAEQYPYNLMGDENPYGTTAVFSRYPLLKGYVLDLKTDRPAVVVKLTLNNQPVTFISAHLLAYGLWWVPILDIPTAIVEKTALQNQQAQRIIDEVSTSQDIVILGCDCNSRERLSSYEMLNAVFTNTSREVGWRVGTTVPDGLRQDRYLKHIDYVFYRGLLQPVGIYAVEDSGGSDHAPILADFVIGRRKID